MWVQNKLCSTTQYDSYLKLGIARLITEKCIDKVLEYNNKITAKIFSTKSKKLLLKEIEFLKNTAEIWCYCELNI